MSYSLDEKQLAKDIGWKPNKWQKEVEKYEARFKILRIGRRGGKSLYAVKSTRDGLVRDLLLPDQYVWIVAPTYDLTQRVWNEFYNICLKNFPKEFFTKITNSKGNYVIKTVLNTTIEAKSAEDPESLIGVGLTKIIIDEASRVKDKAWFQSLRPTLADHRGRAIFISTPNGHNWFHDLYQRGQDKKETDYLSYHYTTYDNDYLSKDEIDDMSKDMPRYEYRQEIMAEFLSTLEQVFAVEKIDKIENFKNSEGTPQLETMGIDLGKSMSYTVITGLYADGQLGYYNRFQGDWPEQVKAIKKAITETGVPYATIDATGKGDPIVDQLIDEGVPVEPFIFSGVSKKQLIDKFALAIEKGIIALPEPTDEYKIIWDELKSFGRHISQSGNIIYKPIKKITDDCVMSLALANWKLYLMEEEEQEESFPTPIVEY